MSVLIFAVDFETKHFMVHGITRYTDIRYNSLCLKRIGVSYSRKGNIVLLIRGVNEVSVYWVV